MKLLTSPWGIALLGGLLNLFLTTAMILPELGRLAKPGLVFPEKTALAPRLWSFKTDAVNDLITELQTEREKLGADQKSVAMQQAQLVSQRAEIQKVQQEIKTMRDGIEQRVVELQETELKNLKTLAQTYAAMNPPAAVAIFREMDENMVVKIFSFMKADRVGPILGEMAKTPDHAGEEPMARRAARITDKLRLLKPLK